MTFRLATLAVFFLALGLVSSGCGCGTPPTRLAHCSDGQTSGDELGVDCGGSCPTECDGGVCQGSACLTPSCTDGLKNGAETDADCGGGSCTACAVDRRCLESSDCASGICAGQECQAGPTCFDAAKNGAETDVDCGGGACAACAAGGACAVASDCQSGVCHTLTGSCSPPTCGDGVRNGAETGVDCGGAACAACPTGGGCEEAGDCQSEVCASSPGVCAAPSCSDGVKNAAETGIDCGGGACPACPTGGECSGAGDCKSGVCGQATGICAAPSCTDGVRNGAETGADCGGADCPACPTGGECSAAGDCQSEVCSPTTGICAAPSCTDGVRNGAETGADCGGGACPACPTGGECSAAGDCQSEVCSPATGICAAPSCTDGVKNAVETGVDCGGGACPACPTGAGCSAAADCQSGVCTPGTEICDTPSCTDGVKNGAETGTDCGGGACPDCRVGGGCQGNSDCLSGICGADTCQEAVTCSDGLLNGTETGVDCGGGACASCRVGGGCLGNSDCASNVCTGAVCQPGATCTDGAKNGSETGVDCGGAACSACPTGGDCIGAGDCQSGVCSQATGICDAPSCTDGVKNGTETSTDCGGGACPACPAGGECSAASDCQSGFCNVNVCQPCSSGAQCAVGSFCVSGACVPDDVAPTLSAAFMPATSVLRVAFSEPMSPSATGSGAANPANYCIEVFDSDPASCTQTADFSVVSVTSVSDSSFDLTLSAAALNKTYTVRVSTASDLAGNPVGAPRHADFPGNPPFRVVSAQSTDVFHVRVVFSKPLTVGPNTTGSSGCSSAIECAKRFKLVGVSDLGAISQAVVSAAPLANEVLLTHSNAQGGGTYSVIAANAADGDGFDNVAAFGSVLPQGGGQNVQPAPNDRASFAGAGTPIVTVNDGPIAIDPFADGYNFSFIFKFNGKIHLGPNKLGAGAVRANADGSSPENVTLSIQKDVTAVGTQSTNSQPGPFSSVGFAGCAKNTYACGPDNEDGRGLFTSGVINGREWLVIGASRTSGPLSYIYMGSDTDSSPALKYVDLSVNRAGAAKTFSTMSVVGGRGYLGFPDTGAKRPVLLNLINTPAAGAAGLDAAGNGTGTSACNPATHDSCNLFAHLMPGIGNQGSPANTASMQMIDFFSMFDSLLYLGNNGGLVRATVANPLDYANAPGHWANISPSAAAYTALSSRTTAKVTDIEPADRAWPQMAVHNGRVYLGRNTTSGPQLWRCDPEVVAAPAPASATQCDPGDWSLVAANGALSPNLSQFDNANNASLTLLVASGGKLYVGFDNLSDGIVIYRSQAAIASSRSDFSGQGGCIAIGPTCAGLGGNGLGAPTVNRRIYDSTALQFGGSDYLYLSTGNDASAVRVYRNQN